MQRDHEARESLISTGSLKSVLALINPVVRKCDVSFISYIYFYHLDEAQSDDVFEMVTAVQFLYSKHNSTASLYNPSSWILMTFWFTGILCNPHAKCT